MKQTTPIALLTSMALLAAILTNSVSSTATAQRRSVPQKTRAPHFFLSRYATDLTAQARSGRLETRTSHRVELTRTINLLSSEGQQNPVLVAESSLNAQEIAESLALKIASGRVPESLQHKQVFRLNVEALSAGAKDGAEFVARLQAVLNDAAAAKGRIILFVDQLHQFVGSYANLQATAAIREALEHNKFSVIGAATPEAYATYISTDDSLTRLFQTISINDQVSQNSDSSKDEDKTETNAFVGDKVSSDMRQMIESASSPDDKVSAILQVDDVKSAELRGVLKRNGGIITDRMAQLGTLRVQLPARAIAELASNPATNFISPDVKLESFDYGHVVITTGTSQVRSQSSGVLGLGGSTLDGTGIGIAVLDSGLDNTHAAFAGGRIKLSKDFTGENRPTVDPFGHGSHVAGSAAGLSTRNGDKYQGVAPAATIINLRVLNSQGIGSSTALLNALNWILSPADPTKPVSSTNPRNKEKYNIRVVNMSLGAPAVSSYRNDPLCRAARALVDAGIVVVAAAGNNGKDANGNKIYGQIHSPGNEPSVITVGAANTFGTDGRNDDGVATYSSRGPTRSYYTDASDSTDASVIKHYDNIVKPEIVAPGNKLIFAESDSGGSSGLLGIGGTASDYNVLVQQHPELDSGLTDDNNRRLMYLSGTSMATPVVTGAVALLLQTKPQLTPNMVKALLLYTAQPLDGFNMLEQGAGELNVEGAVRVAKLVRTDLSNSTPTGSPFLTTSTIPTPQTTVAAQTFTWSRGLIMNHSYLTGTNLIMKYQPIYGLGVIMGDGDVAGDGIMVSDGIMVGDGVIMGDGIMVSDGVIMGDGQLFLAVSMLMGDGIMVGDGVVMGDGVIMGDGIMVSDGVVMGDAAVQAMAARALINGDASTCMH